MTIEEAAVGDVSKEVAAYALYADMIEREQAAAEGGIFSSLKNAISGSSALQDPDCNSVSLEMTSIGSSSRIGQQTSSFRPRTASFQQFMEQQPSFQVLPVGSMIQSETPDQLTSDPASNIIPCRGTRTGS
jgi:hypothetical protein